MARNIHQSRRTRHARPANKPAPQPAAIEQTQTAAAQAPKATPHKLDVHAESLKFAELPSDLMRIGLFTAFVVVLLIVLWLFLK